MMGRMFLVMCLEGMNEEREEEEEEEEEKLFKI